MDPEDLGFEIILEPADPAVGASAIKMEKWKTRYKNWDILTTKRAEASKAAYAVLIGQCSNAMKDRMKTYPQWAGIQSRLNIIGLLELIRTSMYAGTASKKPTLSYPKAESALQN